MSEGESVSGEFDTKMVDRLMAEDAMLVDLEAEFEAIVQLKHDLAGETEEIDKEIAILQEKRDSIAEPYLTAIQEHEEIIRNEILVREKAFKCGFGQAIYRRGAQKVSWDDSALLGYAAAGHSEIEQFRSESEGKASVVLKVDGQK